jgi:hypothetical protein
MIDWEKKIGDFIKRKMEAKEGRERERERKWDLKLKVLASNLSLYFNRLAPS